MAIADYGPPDDYDDDVDWVAWLIGILMLVVFFYAISH